MLRRLAAAEQRHGVAAADSEALAAGDGDDELPAGVERDGRLLRIRLGDLDVVLNARRGLAISSFIDRSVAEQSLFGTIEHGYFETNRAERRLVQSETSSRSRRSDHKVTDLEPMTPRFSVAGDAITVHGSAETVPRPDREGGHDRPRADASIELELDAALAASCPPGSLRLGSS